MISNAAIIIAKTFKYLYLKHLYYRYIFLYNKREKTNFIKFIKYFV